MRLGLVAVLCAVAATCSQPISKVIPTHRSECVFCETDDEMARCQDALDNDQDLLFDCDDPDCADYAACNIQTAAEENTSDLCSDGFDNDNNSFADCFDWACHETDACKDPVQKPENEDALCYDLLDNDHDGLVDCRDPDCRAGVVTVCEGSNTTCADGIDNDGNGFTDCGDFSCSKSGDVSICD